MKYLTLTIALLISINTFAAGTHSHSHDAKPKKNTCTPEHAAMGHCKMEDHGNHNHGGHSSAVGKPSKATASETVHVDMLDSMRFEFKEEFTIKAGKTMSFLVTNKGAIDHEFSIGNALEQENHAKMMMANPTMQHGDGEAAITVKPGQTKTLTWTFAGNETVVFACTLPGHYQAGMFYKQNIIK